MALFSPGNPSLSETTFRGLPRVAGDLMTLQGTVNKTGFALLAVLAGASITWNVEGPLLLILLLTGFVGGLVLAIATVIKKEWAPVTTVPYGFLEGLVLGAISRMYEARSQGVAVMAVGLTLAVLCAMLLAYSSRIIRVTETFRMGVVTATGGIALFYLISMGLSFFGVRTPLIHDATPLGILFSLVVVGIAAMNLVLNFDFIERGAAGGAPKYMEWYGAFGMLVTLVWLYLELLRLLAKITGRRR
jgi:uncharacterized YccA/Bax inhibitor family protein